MLTRDLLFNANEPFVKDNKFISKLSDSDVFHPMWLRFKFKSYLAQVRVPAKVEVKAPQMVNSVSDYQLNFVKREVEPNISM